MTTTEYQCCHEDLLNSHSLQIRELETEVAFKKEKIDNLQEDMKEIKTKIDIINNNVNKLILESKSDDKELELRLKAIETELKLTKETAKANYTRLATIGGIVSIALVILDLYLKYGLK